MGEHSIGPAPLTVFYRISRKPKYTGVEEAMKRIRLRFTRDVDVVFADREGGIRRAEELAEKGTRFPLVVFGPEGCGKTAWLRQVAEILRSAEYDVVYVNPCTATFSHILVYENLLGGLQKL